MVSFSSSSSSSSESYLFIRALVNVSPRVRLGFLDINGELVQDKVLVRLLVDGLQDLALIVTTFCGEVLVGDEILVGDTEDSLDPGLNSISS